MAGLRALSEKLACYAGTEPWKPAHETVMRNHDAADALKEDAAFGLYIYERLCAFRPTTFEDSLALYEAYLNWHQRSLHLLRRIEASGQREFPVDNASEFRVAFEEVNAILDQLKGRKDAVEAFIDGRGEDFREVFGLV